MTDYRPGAIDSAIAAQKRRLESLDPRFDVDIEISEGKRHYHFRANTEVRSKLRFKTQSGEDATRLHHLTERGLPVHFGAGEVEIDDMPLLREKLSEGATVQFARRVPATLSVYAWDNDGTQRDGIYGIVGQLEGGRTECRYTGDLEGCPMTFAITFRSEKQGQAWSCHVDMEWLPERWFGRP